MSGGRVSEGKDTMCFPVVMTVCKAALPLNEQTPRPQRSLEYPCHPPLPASALGAAAQALTSGPVEARGVWVPTVGGDSFRAVVANRAGETGGLASQVTGGASRARLGEAGAPGAEVTLGAGPPHLLCSKWSEERKEAEGCRSCHSSACWNLGRLVWCHKDQMWISVWVRDPRVLEIMPITNICIAASRFKKQQ